MLLLDRICFALYLCGKRAAKVVSMKSVLTIYEVIYTIFGGLNLVFRAKNVVYLITLASCLILPSTFFYNEGINATTLGFAIFAAVHLGLCMRRFYYHYHKKTEMDERLLDLANFNAFGYAVIMLGFNLLIK